MVESNGLNGNGPSRDSSAWITSHSETRFRSPRHYFWAVLDYRYCGAGVADIERNRWHDSVPQPPARVPRTDYKRMTTRLYLEGVAPGQVAAFVHGLHAKDPTLRLAGFNLTSRRPDTPDFDVELGIAYLVLAPHV